MVVSARSRFSRGGGAGRSGPTGTIRPAQSSAGAKTSKAPRRLGSVSADWPPQVDLILSALDTGQHDTKDRRGSSRQPYRVRAHLRLFIDGPAASPWVVFTRDVHTRGMGFVSPHRLPLGYGGSLEIPDPCNPTATLSIHCTLLRCREAAPGWYEGSLYFNREQPEFGV